MHRSVYVSIDIDLFTRLSIDLAIKSHCTYPLLCFKNRCLQELPLRYFPSSAYGCTIGVGDKTDAKRRRDTDGSEKTPSFQRSNDNTGNNMVICCRLASAARKDTRSIESRASKTDTCESSHCACHEKCIFADPLQMSHACHRFWKCYKTLMFCSLLNRCRIPCACHAKRHLTSKNGPYMVCLYILTWKCASRHNGVHFFDISTSKSGPTMVCFVHFDLEMYFAPQRRALFRHLNFQKSSGAGVFCTF